MHRLEEIQAYAEQHPAPELLSFVAGLFPGTTRFSSSLGQEDQVLTDMIAWHARDIEVFTLDTGRLFNETYELLEKIGARYRLPVKVYFPDAAETEALVRERGINGFYESIENRKACCEVRKVRPLERALAGAKVWITGIRADQSSNRGRMDLVEWDERRGLYKLNPLLHWTLGDVREYLSAHNVPYNILHDQGYLSIGCAPCTRATAPGEDARAGRWWWETSKKECGLHQVK